MKCPACNASLAEMKTNALDVDVCANSCGGIWLDRDEILKVDETSEFDVQSLVKITPAEDLTLVEPGKRECPRCPGNFLVPQFYDPQNPVEIDMCWNCTGIWLDYNEIYEIRSGGGDKSAGGNPAMREGIDIAKLSQALGSEEQAESYVSSIGALMRKVSALF